MIFDATQCALGEGPLWHPLRKSLFWFDINHKLMFERGLSDDQAKVYKFDEHVSAAGWIDDNTLLIASETALFCFDLVTSESAFVVGLESENPITRSNDGRADPYGGFWIGTMGKKAEVQAGAIYRYYCGELRRLFANITISNSICFAPDGKTAYFCDTPKRKIMKIALDKQGWPNGKPEQFADVAPHNPDGSVVDADGHLWNAQWGASRVACYASNGEYVREIKFQARQISCPAFGGADIKTLFATSANENLTTSTAADGATYIVKTETTGQAEHKVVL